MRPDLEVDTEALRLWATQLRRSGAWVHADPPPTVAGPRWASTAANTGAADAASHVLEELAADIIALGSAAASTADDYEEADARVARSMAR